MKNVSRVALIMMLIAFIAGIAALFELRFRRGDIYPPYSSLRSDPLGAKVLYESLETCCGYAVRRNFGSFRKIAERPDSAVLFLGLKPMDFEDVPQPLVDQFDAFILAGGRLVLVLLPSQKELEDLPKLPEKEDEEEFHYVSLSAHWGFEIRTNAGAGDVPAKGVEASLPDEITSQTIVYFRNLSRPWTTLYSVDGRPVMIERTMGRGSIFISALSYFLSNEAMVKERSPALLLHVIGSKRQIVFDEFHHGISDNPGVAYFIRKYRLGWTVAGLILLAILFVWKSSALFIPPDSSGPVLALTEGKDSMEALTNLLRRNVSSAQVLAACWKEWEKGHSFFHRARRLPPNKLERIYSIISRRRQKDAADGYNEISQILKERK